MDQSTQSNQGTESTLLTPQELRQPLAPQSVEASVETVLKNERQATAATFAPADYHAKFSEEVHNYVREYIRNADQKAGFFFAGATALLAFLYGHGGTAYWQKSLRAWGLADVVSFVAMLALSASACVLLSVVFPRLKGSRRGFIFFSAVAEYEAGRDYANDVLRQPVEELVNAKLTHAYDLCRVCVAKYRSLRVAFWIGAVGVVCALLFMIFSVPDGSSQLVAPTTSSSPVQVR
jgi:hypothetical protein